MTSAGVVTVPVESVQELAKWAYAASYFDGLVPMRTLQQIPDVGRFIDDIAARNAARDAAEFPEDFDSL